MLSSVVDIKHEPKKNATGYITIAVIIPQGRTWKYRYYCDFKGEKISCVKVV